MARTTVVKARQKGVKGYRLVTRGTRFGNPFSVEGWGRENAIKMFREYLAIQVGWRGKSGGEFLPALLALRGCVLGCTCPKEIIELPGPIRLCHAHVLADYLNSLPD